MRQIQAITVLALLLLSSVLPIYAGEKGTNKGVCASVMVHASQSDVWKAVCDTKSFEESVKSVNGNEAIVEQKLKSIPIFGTILVVVKTKVFPQQRIEYELIHSDRLKELNGTWLLTPINNKRTKLELSTYVDPGLPVPRFLVNAFAAGRCRNRLKRVKALAEATPDKGRINHTASSKKETEASSSN